MIISYSKKFVYLRTIKVASSSLEFYFSQFCGSEDIITPLDSNEEKIKQKYGLPISQNNTYKSFSLSIKNIFKLNLYSNKRIHEHSSLDQLPTVKVKNIKNFFCFTFIRNPFDWIVSYFWWHLHHHKKKNISYINNLSSKKISFFFKQFMKSECENFFESNKDIISSKNVKIKVFKLEQLEKNIKIIKKKLKFKNEKIKIYDLNFKSLRIKKKIKLDLEDIKIIFNTGSYFFDNFKYSKKVPSKYLL